MIWQLLTQTWNFFIKNITCLCQQKKSQKNHKEGEAGINYIEALVATSSMIQKEA